jgi:hypothetical protein
VTSTGASTPRRQAAISPLRRLSRNVLIIGTVIAVVAAFGPVWMVRVGVVVAVAAAVIACFAAWRELAEARRAHAAEMLAASHAHGDALRQERTQNASVVDVLTGRAEQAAAKVKVHQATIAELNCTIGTLRSEVSTLHGDNAFAHAEIRHRETVIATLRETVRAREAELIALSEAAGQVRAIPRRVLAEHESAWDRIPDADDLWSDGNHPTIADLIDVSVSLPNYEGERRFA